MQNERDWQPKECSCSYKTHLPSNTVASIRSPWSSLPSTFYLLPYMIHSTQRHLFRSLVPRIRILRRWGTRRFGFTDSDRFACGFRIQTIRGPFVSPAELGVMLDIRSDQVLGLECNQHAYHCFKFESRLLRTFHSTVIPPSSPQASWSDHFSSTKRSSRLENPRISTVWETSMDHNLLET